MASASQVLANETRVFSRNISGVPISVRRKARTRHLLHGAYRFIGYYIFGCLLTWLLTDVLKAMVGRLRPNFIDVCKPHSDLVDFCANVRASLTCPGV